MRWHFGFGSKREKEGGKDKTRDRWLRELEDGNEGNEDEDECDGEEGEVAIGNTILDYHFGFPRMDPRTCRSTSSFSVFAGTPSSSSSCLQMLGNGLLVPEEGAYCS